MALARIALLLSFSLHSILSDDSERKACSEGTLDYICKNYDICSKYGTITEEQRTTLCLSIFDESSDPTPPSSPPPTTGRVDVDDYSTTVQRITHLTSTPYSELPTGTDDTGVRTQRTTPTSIYHTRDGFTVKSTDSTGSTNPNGYTTQPFSTESKGPVTDEDGSLLVEKVPEITDPPVNTTVAPGGSGRFSCTAEAATTPLITITPKDQTSRPSLDSFNKNERPGQQKQTSINTIKINNVDEPNEGWYTCLACNRAGCAEHDAYLHVKDLCEGVVCSGTKECVGNYAEGEGYTCECPEFCPYDDLITPDSVCSNYCEDHYNECMMKTDACKTDKPGIDVMNRGRCGRIQHPEIFEQEMEHGIKTLYEDAIMELECSAMGFPEPEIIWYRGDVEVGKGNVFTKKVKKADEGLYTCVAVNCMRTKVSRLLAELYVNQATPEPEIDDFEIDAPRSTCAVFGDPHFLTFDMNAYSYMGTCDNVLAMDCKMARWFVYGRLRPCGREDGSCLESVTVYVGRDVVELQRGWLVNDNGEKIVPKNHVGDIIEVPGEANMTLKFDGTMLRLTVPLGKTEVQPNVFQLEKLVVLWDGFLSVQVQVPMSSRTCGMCGNNDGKPNNDLKTRRSGRTDDPVAFGDSWKIDRRGRCADAPPTETPEEACGARYEEVKAECERVFGIEKFKACIALGHDVESWIQGCIYDECEMKMQVEDLPPKCMVANAYAIRCSQPYWARDETEFKSDKNVAGWEEEAVCPDSDERYQPVLDSGCPQPTLEEELAMQGA